MGAKELIKKLIEKQKDYMKEREDMDDDKTIDKYLRSLRRERRMQLEELEKAKLIKNIAAFKSIKQRKHFFGDGQESHTGIFPKRKKKKDKNNSFKLF